MIKNRRLTIRWGRSQGQKNPIAADGGSAAAAVAPGTVTVPGLAPTLPKPPEELTNNFFNIGAGMLPRILTVVVLLCYILIILSNRHVHDEMPLTADAGPSGAGVSGTSPAAAAAISAAISANPYLSSTATRVPGQVRFNPLTVKSMSLVAKFHVA